MVPAVSEPYTTTIDPRDAGFDMDAVDALRSKVAQQVDEGRMPACQLAFGFDGELAVFDCFGEATPEHPLQRVLRHQGRSSAGSCGSSSAKDGCPPPPVRSS